MYLRQMVQPAQQVDPMQYLPGACVQQTACLAHCLVLLSVLDEPLLLALDAAAMRQAQSADTM